MKKLLYYAITLLFVSVTTITIKAQNANTSLSNLVSPSKVNVSLLPKSGDTRDLGSPAKPWRNIYCWEAYFLNSTKL